MGKPPGEGHGGRCGGDEEEGVHGREDTGVGVEHDESGVARLVESEEFGVAVGPIGSCPCFSIQL